MRRTEPSRAPSRAAVLGVLVRSIGHSNPLIGHQVPRHADPSGIE